MPLSCQQIRPLVGLALFMCATGATLAACKPAPAHRMAQRQSAPSTSPGASPSANERAPLRPSAALTVDRKLELPPLSEADKALMDQAFRLAFKGPAPVRLNIPPDDVASFEPLGLLHVDGRLVLIAGGTNQYDSHASMGALSIAYLRQTPAGLRLLGRWLIPDSGSSHGNFEDPSLRPGLLRHMTIAAEGGFVGQGCEEGWEQLIELTPTGPQARATIHTSQKKTVFLSTPDPNVFFVRYVDAPRKTVKYTLTGRRYLPSPKLPADDFIYCPDPPT